MPKPKGLYRKNNYCYIRDLFFCMVMRGKNLGVPKKFETFIYYDDQL